MEKRYYNYISQEIINKNKYNYSCYIGACTKLISECNPTTFEEWELFYNNYMESSGLRNKLNLIIIKLSIQYKIPIEDLKEVFKTRAIDNTWSGYLRENKGKILIEELIGLKLKHSSYENDSKLGVDYFGYYDNDLVVGIQIKPLSYIKGNGSQILRDKAINKKKYEEFYKKYGVKIVEVAINIEKNCIEYGENELVKEVYLNVK